MPSADEIWNAAVAEADRLYEESKRDPEAEAREREEKLQKIANELLQVKLEQLEEEVLREKHPALKDLWEKYQAMKKLVRTDVESK